MASWEPKGTLDSQQSPYPRKRKIRRKPKPDIAGLAPEATNQSAKSPGGSKKSLEMVFGSELMPTLSVYYQSHLGLSIHGRLTPLFTYPVEVLALCSRFHFSGREVRGSGTALFDCAPPPKLPNASLHEHYTLWAEDIRRASSAILAKDPKNTKVRRYRRNLEVLEFMRCTWDAVLTGYQVERAVYLTRYGHYSVLNSRRLQGIDRFRKQLVHHPLEAAQRVKACAQACRSWYFGGPRPSGRLLVFEEKKVSMLASYVARSLPPAPPSQQGLRDLVSRLTGDVPPEPDYWAPFVKAYFQRFPPKRKLELYTMPSSNAALGYPRSRGGHIVGVQHLVLLGYALKRVRGSVEHPSMMDDQTGGYLELLSDSLHPSSQKVPHEDPYLLFRRPWDELEKSLPGAGAYLQEYLKVGTLYVLDKLERVPILPIVAEERGLKTRYPTCCLTAVNLVQQILRRVIDSAMINDPRFSEALGGPKGIDLRGEAGPWESQDCTAATDLHPEWLTRTVYEELADKCPQLQPYRKYFHLLFGSKRLLIREYYGDGSAAPKDYYVPKELFSQYPRAPLLDDRFTPHVRGEKFGHGSNILRIWDDWLNFLNREDGVDTTTGQMMGDPTSFPPLMLVTACAAEQVLKVLPYSQNESKKRHRGLKRHEAVLKGVGDDALLPRWHWQRRLLYHVKLAELAAVVSVPKSYWHALRGLIAEVALESGFPVPFWPLSALVAPPGGSKGQVSWVSQPTAFGGDPTRPTKRIPKFFWKLSPYYYTWNTARRLGIPLAAPEAYGGIGLPIYPKVAMGYHVQWLSYLSQRSIEELVVGLGLGAYGSSKLGLLDRAATGWLKEVLSARSQWEAEGLELLSTCALSDEAIRRVSIEDGFATAVSRLRSVEFYFRAPSELRQDRVPSVRKAASRFTRLVSSAKVMTGKSSPSYAKTATDLERKKQIFFSTSGGFLPDAWSPVPGFYGLETSGTVRRKLNAPWLQWVG